MNKRIVALDVGDRRIGIAVSDPLGITAQPVETYTRVGYGPDVRHITGIAGRYETDQILCGLPRNMDGTQGFQADKVREFAAKLEEQGMTVSYYDERMTTMLAEGALLEANMRRADRKKKVDMICANSRKVAGAGFGVDTNVLTLITADSVEELPLMSKEEAAGRILDRAIEQSHR